MRMRKKGLIGKKPKILKTKIEIFLLLKKCENLYKIKSMYQSPLTYFKGEYKAAGYHITIYVQRYIQGFRRLRINYIDIHHKKTHKALSVTELKDFLKELKVCNYEKFIERNCRPRIKSLQ
jgi:hypothetical protein